MARAGSPGRVVAADTLDHDVELVDDLVFVELLTTGRASSSIVQANSVTASNPPFSPHPATCGTDSRM